MLNPLSFKSCYIPNYGACAVPNNAQVSCTSNSPISVSYNQSQELMQKKTAELSKLYALMTPKLNVTIENKTLDERVDELKSLGKDEGKDFEIKKSDFGADLKILENGKVTKVYNYKNEGKSKDDFSSLDMFSYPINSDSSLDFVSTTYAPDGRIMYKSFEYKAENSPYQNDLAYHRVSPADYKNYLASQGISYTENTKSLGEGGKSVTFSFVEPQSGKNVEYCFIVDIASDKTQEVEKTIKDNSGQTSAILVFYRNNKTAYTQFY